MTPFSVRQGRDGGQDAEGIERINGKARGPGPQDPGPFLGTCSSANISVVFPFLNRHWRDTRGSPTSGVVIVRCPKRYSCGAKGPSPCHASFAIFLSKFCNHT